eukprot:evm.model.scf_612.3 EVM.evm.TU.scf_612.3   scf_612:19279-28385(-)
MRRREVEDNRSEIKRYYGQQRVMDVDSMARQKDDVRRRSREAKERQAEQDILEGLYRVQATKELSAQRSEEEDKIAGELERRHNEKERRERAVQSVRERSEELRELAEKIRTAQVNKERHLQKMEHQIIAAKEAQYHSLFDDLMEHKRVEGVEAENEQQRLRREGNIKSRHVLKEQMQEKEEAKRAAQMEYDKEKAMIDEVVRRIEEEDAAEVHLKLAKKQETLEYVKGFLEERERLRREQKEKENLEDRRIMEYWEHVRGREGDEAARKQTVADEADRIYRRLFREKEAQIAARLEEERLMDLLRAEEEEQKRQKAAEERRERAERQREAMMRENEAQMKLKAERDAQRREEEERFRQEMVRKFAEDDRIDQMNAQRRRMKQLEHRREVERLIDEKRAMYEETLRREAEEEMERREAEARREVLVEEERRRLLREAANLKDYFPKGVLRDQEELDYVNHVAKEAEDQKAAQS